MQTQRRLLVLILSTTLGLLLGSSMLPAPAEASPAGGFGNCFSPTNKPVIQGNVVTGSAGSTCSDPTRVVSNVFLTRNGVYLAGHDTRSCSHCSSIAKHAHQATRTGGTACYRTVGQTLYGDLLEFETIGTSACTYG